MSDRPPIILPPRSDYADKEQLLRTLVEVACTILAREQQQRAAKDTVQSSQQRHP